MRTMNKRGGVTDVNVTGKGTKKIDGHQRRPITTMTTTTTTTPT